MLRERFVEAFGKRTRDEWAERFAGSDACVAPVLTPSEAPGHPHNAARGTFLPGDDGTPQPAPAPRFGRTGCEPPRPPAVPGTDTSAVLAELGLSGDQIAALRAAGTVG